MGLGYTNHSRVEIMHDSKQYTYHEHRRTTFSSIFSQIGGSLGLFLGASIISVIELSIFLMQWIWYKCCPTRTVKSSQLYSTSSKRTKSN
ncbi:acid-sensing ion channel 1-like [Parasteatoda tepidariorum]|uniref:acid-sensing ion channel 1-like n=1 Tax=Parasteatoda tepidariorum TaxID=114398 RepID=UPI001C72064E|nr:acid-sensing ion channel 1-like [Parasteatoda tepidariorum]